MNEMNANAVETKEPENATASTPPKIIAVDFDGCLRSTSGRRWESPSGRTSIG